MAVTLYRQVGKGKARRYQKVNLGRGRRPTNLTGLPTSYGIRSPTAPVHGNQLATTSTRQSTRRRGSRHISRLSTQTFRSSKTKTNPGERKSLTLSFSGSPSFSFFRARTNTARARRHCERTTTVSDSSWTLPPNRTCGT
jgi:hypothetical protein